MVDLLDDLIDAGKATTANRIRAYLSKFFGWCSGRDVIEVPPTLNVKAPAKEKSRERFLIDDEIRWLWQACEATLTREVLAFPVKVFGPSISLYAAPVPPVFPKAETRKTRPRAGLF